MPASRVLAIFVASRNGQRPHDAELSAWSCILAHLPDYPPVLSRFPPGPGVLQRVVSACDDAAEALSTDQAGVSSRESCLSATMPAPISHPLNTRLPVLYSVCDSHCASLYYPDKAQQQAMRLPIHRAMPLRNVPTSLEDRHLCHQLCHQPSLAADDDIMHADAQQCLAYVQYLLTAVHAKQSRSGSSSAAFAMGNKSSRQERKRAQSLGAGLATGANTLAQPRQIKSVAAAPPVAKPFADSAFLQRPAGEPSFLADVWKDECLLNTVGFLFDGL